MAINLRLYFTIFTFLFLPTLLHADSHPFNIIDKPISYGADRKKLTIEYMRIHYGGNPKNVEIIPRAIVLHWTGNGAFMPIWNLFNRTHLGSGRKDIAGGGSVQVSAHFIVDRDGKIYRIMPENWMARHCIGLNHLAIGIENIGDGNKFPLTEEQLKANVALIRYLVKKHTTITHLFGHHEYRKMEKHPYFKELDPKYRTNKIDPGDAFMTMVRQKIIALSLKKPPE
ncbi:peptidoglycan recognition family protein [Candidatus Riflebacteria bacterium]